MKNYWLSFKDRGGGLSSGDTRPFGSRSTGRQDNFAADGLLPRSIDNYLLVGLVNPIEQFDLRPRKKVLVIDDDQDLLSLVASVLEDEGYEVVTAEDGLAGLRAVAAGLPDLILLDMKMPVMNGWDFARNFREKYDRRVPIVVITAYENAKKRAEEIGANGWIGKPFDLDMLSDVVRRYVRK